MRVQACARTINFLKQERRSNNPKDFGKKAENMEHVYGAVASLDKIDSWARCKAE